MLLTVISTHPVSPDAIHEHVKTKREEMSMRPHYTAPEYAEGPVGTAADIYAFGMCALEVRHSTLHGYSVARQQVPVAGT